MRVVGNAEVQTESEAERCNSQCVGKTERPKKDRKRKIGIPQLPPQDHLPILLSIPHPTCPNHEKAMMPRRIISHIRPQHVLHKLQFTLPQTLLIVEIREQPLPVAPRVVVLRIVPEATRDERELRGGLAQESDEEASVVPDLVGFEVFHSELVHEFELNVERGIDREERFIAILPVVRLPTIKIVVPFETET